MKLLGRENEQKIFKHCIQSSESKLVAVYGRRRVGKTFLIRKYFKDQIRFEVSGLFGGDMKDQLAHFTQTLARSGYYPASISAPKSWMAAFEMLGLYVSAMKDKRKKVIFIDELPWFDTPRSKFLMAFTNFWNAYCTKREDMLVVICGSAASWMIQNIVQNKGGLHNRVSEKIRLQAFTLYETEQYLKHKGIRWSQYDIVQLYMTTGGVPYYLDAIRKGESVVQFINRACFTKQGVLSEEFNELYASLFQNSEHHRLIIKILGKVKQGLTRKEIVHKSKLKSGGTLTKVLEELEKSDFIKKVAPYMSNKNGVLYKLVDHFSIFYLKFMHSSSNKSKENWTKTVMSQSWKSWSGFAFERICFSHILQIKKALGLQVIESQETSWQISDDTKGAQIDLLIDRSDRIINVCEIKFSRGEFTIDKAYATNLRNKIDRFSNVKGNRKKNLFLTMITTFGVVENKYSLELVQNEITLSDLFVHG